MDDNTVQTIACHFQNESALYLSYMPFIKGGGLFIRTKQAYQLGDLVVLQVHLPNLPEEYVINGQVVWITPIGAQGNKPAGIGVQFAEDKSRDFCNKIETILAGMLKSTQITDTL